MWYHSSASHANRVPSSLEKSRSIPANGIDHIPGVIAFDVVQFGKALSKTGHTDRDDGYRAYACALAGNGAVFLCKFFDRCLQTITIVNTRA